MKIILRSLLYVISRGIGMVVIAYLTLVQLMLGYWLYCTVLAGDWFFFQSLANYSFTALSPVPDLAYNSCVRDSLSDITNLFRKQASENAIIIINNYAMAWSTESFTHFSQEQLSKAFIDSWDAVYFFIPQLSLENYINTLLKILILLNPISLIKDISLWNSEYNLSFLEYNSYLRHGLFYLCKILFNNYTSYAERVAAYEVFLYFMVELAAPTINLVPLT